MWGCCILFGAGHVMVNSLLLPTVTAIVANYYFETPAGCTFCCHEFCPCRLAWLPLGMLLQLLCVYCLVAICIQCGAVRSRSTLATLRNCLMREMEPPAAWQSRSRPVKLPGDRVPCAVQSMSQQAGKLTNANTAGCLSCRLFNFAGE
jgi:hypothetical protein